MLLINFKSIENLIDKKLKFILQTFVPLKLAIFVSSQFKNEIISLQKAL